MPVKCKNCGMRLRNNRSGHGLVIDDNPYGIPCVSCWSYHSWATGDLIKKGGEKK